jgi:hypothetical protein
MAGKVILTQYPGEADHKVYFTDYPGDEMNAALLKGCKLTKYPGEADFKLFITEYPGEATIKIMRANFPR